MALRRGFVPPLVVPEASPPAPVPGARVSFVQGDPGRSKADALQRAFDRVANFGLAVRPDPNIPRDRGYLVAGAGKDRVDAVAYAMGGSRFHRYDPRDWPRSFERDFDALKLDSFGGRTLSEVLQWLRAMDGHPVFPTEVRTSTAHREGISTANLPSEADRYEADLLEHARPLHAALVLWFEREPVIHAWDCALRSGRAGARCSCGAEP